LAQAAAIALPQTDARARVRRRRTSRRRRLTAELLRHRPRERVSAEAEGLPGGTGLGAAAKPLVASRATRRTTATASASTTASARRFATDTTRSTRRTGRRVPRSATGATCPGAPSPGVTGAVRARMAGFAGDAARALAHDAAVSPFARSVVGRAGARAARGLEEREHEDQREGHRCRRSHAARHDTTLLRHWFKTVRASTVPACDFTNFSMLAARNPDPIVASAQIRDGLVRLRQKTVAIPRRRSCRRASSSWPAPGSHCADRSRSRTSGAAGPWR
jgi:hypothetical protein